MSGIIGGKFPAAGGPSGSKKKNCCLRTRRVRLYIGFLLLVRRVSSTIAAVSSTLGCECGRECSSAIDDDGEREKSCLRDRKSGFCTIAKLSDGEPPRAASDSMRSSEGKRRGSPLLIVITQKQNVLISNYRLKGILKKIWGKKRTTMPGTAAALSSA